MVQNVQKVQSLRSVQPPPLSSPATAGRIKEGGTNGLNGLNDWNVLNARNGSKCFNASNVSRVKNVQLFN